MRNKKHPQKITIEAYIKSAQSYQMDGGICIFRNRKFRNVGFDIVIKRGAGYHKLRNMCSFKVSAHERHILYKYESRFLLCKVCGKNKQYVLLKDLILPINQHAKEVLPYVNDTYTVRKNGGMYIFDRYSEVVKYRVSDRYIEFTPIGYFGNVVYYVCSKNRELGLLRSRYGLINSVAVDLHIRK